MVRIRYFIYNFTVIPNMTPTFLLESIKYYICSNKHRLIFPKGSHSPKGRADVQGRGLHQRHHRNLPLHQTRAQHLGAAPEADHGQ